MFLVTARLGLTAQVTICISITLLVPALAGPAATPPIIVNIAVTAAVAGVVLAILVQATVARPMSLVVVIRGDTPPTTVPRHTGTPIALTAAAGRVKRAPAATSHVRGTTYTPIAAGVGTAVLTRAVT